METPVPECGMKLYRFYNLTCQEWGNPFALCPAHYVEMLTRPVMLFFRIEEVGETDQPCNHCLGEEWRKATHDPDQWPALLDAVERDTGDWPNLGMSPNKCWPLPPARLFVHYALVPRGISRVLEYILRERKSTLRN
jgi:hypothetical protein